jgi:hypothetical protein
MYGIWNAKPYLLEEVAKSNPFNSTYFFWHDIGAMRMKGEEFRNWPDEKRIHDLLDGEPHLDTIMLNVVGRQPCYIHAGHIAQEPPEVSFTISGQSSSPTILIECVTEI